MTEYNIDTARTEFIANTRCEINRIGSRLDEVQRNWVREQGKIPFSSYVHVVKYFLRTTKIDPNAVSVKSGGKSITIIIKAPKHLGSMEFKATIKDGCMNTRTYLSRNLTDEEMLEKWKEEFPKYCKNHGLKPEDFGKEFILPGRDEKLQIIGCKRRKQTYGVVCRYVNAPNKRTAVKADVVVEALKGKNND